MRTAISLDDQLLDQLKRRAAESGTFATASRDRSGGFDITRWADRVQSIDAE